MMLVKWSAFKLVQKGMMFKMDYNIGRIFTVVVPQDCKISKIGFCAALVDKVSHYTSDEINLIVDNTCVNLKSLLGVLSIVFSEGKELKFQVIGETAEYTAQSLKRFVTNLFNLYM